MPPLASVFYQFNESDLRISVQQLQMFVDLYDKDPFKALNYCTGECNYGGRVTDDKDRRCLMTILKRFYCPELGEGYKFSPLPDFRVPEATRHSDYCKYIETLPLAGPAVFGLHENATITKDQTETTTLFNAILLTEASSGGGSGGTSKEDVMDSVARGTLTKIPENFDMEVAELKYPVKWAESMNTVLCQELQRFNKLTNVIRQSCVDITKAVQVRKQSDKTRGGAAGLMGGVVWGGEECVV